MGVSIIGTGKYIPDFLLTNQMLEKLTDTTDEWITTRTGIKERHLALDMPTWQLGAKAAADAISDSGINPSEIDLVICTAVTVDYITPSTACLIAKEVGAVNAVGIDINTACAGFVFAMDAANRYLNDYPTILLVSPERMTRIIDYSDRATCVLFGDGAGAAIVRKNDKPFYSLLGGDVSGATELFARGSACSTPFSEGEFDLHLTDGLPETNGTGLYQNGKEVYKFATHAMPTAVEGVCKKMGITPAELDLIVSHQANIRIIATAAKNLGLPMEKFFINIEKYGNMSSACVPVALHEAIKENRLQRGQKVCLVGFGAGLVYGAVGFEY